MGLLQYTDDILFAYKSHQYQNSCIKQNESGKRGWITSVAVNSMRAECPSNWPRVNLSILLIMRTIIK